MLSTGVVAAGIDVSGAGQYSWVVDVPSSELLVTDEWVFRFLPSGVSYPGDGEQVSSSGVYISGDVKSSSSQTVLATTTVAPPIGQSSTSTNTLQLTTQTGAGTQSSATSSATSSDSTAGAAGSTSSSSPASTASSSSLSTGTIVGAVIGGVAGVIGLIGLTWYLTKRSSEKKKARISSANPSYPDEDKRGLGMDPVPSYTRSEIPTYRAELPQGTPVMPAELGVHGSSRV